MDEVLKVHKVVANAKSICYAGLTNIKTRERVPYVLPHICLQETFYYFILAFLAKEGINSNINKIVCYMYICMRGGTYAHGTLAKTRSKFNLVRCFVHLWVYKLEKWMQNTRNMAIK